MPKATTTELTIPDGCAYDPVRHAPTIFLIRRKGGLIENLVLEEKHAHYAEVRVVIRSTSHKGSKRRLENLEIDVRRHGWDSWHRLALAGKDRIPTWQNICLALGGNPDLVSSRTCRPVGYAGHFYHLPYALYGRSDLDNLPSGGVYFNGRGLPELVRKKGEEPENRVRFYSLPIINLLDAFAAQRHPHKDGKRTGHDPRMHVHSVPDTDHALPLERETQHAS